MACFTILLEVPTLTYSFLLVYQVHHSTMLYGRQCMPLSGVKNYEFHGPIQKKRQWIVQLGSHLLALIMS